jgi:hypothetical protein
MLIHHLPFLQLFIPEDVAQAPVVGANATLPDITNMSQHFFYPLLMYPSSYVVTYTKAVWKALRI